MGCPLPPSMKKIRALAPSNTDSSLGQPPVTTTGSTPVTCDRHLASSLQPALNSWAPGPWLGRPAIRTILAGLVDRGAAANTVVPRPRAISPVNSLLNTAIPHLLIHIIDYRMTNAE